MTDNPPRSSTEQRRIEWERRQAERRQIEQRRGITLKDPPKKRCNTCK